MAEKKTVSAKAVVADIKAGMTDEQLMRKYQVSAKGLQSLKNRLLAAGFLTQAVLNGPTPESTEDVKPNQVQVETGRNTQANIAVPENPDRELSPTGEGSANAQRGLPAILAGCALVAWIIQAFFVHKRFWFIVWDLIFGVLTLAAAASIESEFGKGEGPDDQSRSDQVQIAGSEAESSELEAECCCNGKAIDHRPKKHSQRGHKHGPLADERFPDDHRGKACYDGPHAHAHIRAALGLSEQSAG